MMRAIWSRRIVLASAVACAALACTVPSLRDLGEKRCDVDAGHPCVTGYECSPDGFCVIPEGGSCNPGVVRPCGSDEGECKKGQQKCVDGVWAACTGETGPADETCNGKDDDCDGVTDDHPIDGALVYADQDKDGHGDPQNSQRVCSPPAGFVSSSDDCDDTRAEAHPGATELCNGLDDNCNGEPDEGVDDSLKTTFYADNDGDDAGGMPVRACALRTGLVANDGDCNDDDPNVHPGAMETCNGNDDNCNGTTDEGVLLDFFLDNDHDGFGAGPAVKACSAPTNYVGNASDCNDSLSSVHPGALELCNTRDDDCDGIIDDPLEVPLVTSPGGNTGELVWVLADGGLSAAYTDELDGGVPHVYFQRFSKTLAAEGSAVDLSYPTALASSSPSIAELGNDAVVAWLESVTINSAVAHNVRVARVDAQGNLAWPSNTVTSTYSPVIAPKVAVDPSGSVMLVAWIAGTSARAIVVNSAGKEQMPSAVVVSGSEVVTGLAVAANAKSLTAPEFDLLTAGTSDAGYEVRFRRFDVTSLPDAGVALSLVAQNAFPVSSASPGVALASDLNAPPGDSAAWIDATPANGLARVYGTSMPFTPGSPSLLTTTDAGVSGLVGASSVSQGAVWAWAEGTPPSVQTYGGFGPAHNLTFPRTLEYAPALTWLGSGTQFAVGYARDGGSSQDLYGVVRCAP